MVFSIGGLFTHIRFILIQRVINKNKRVIWYFELSRKERVLTQKLKGEKMDEVEVNKKKTLSVYIFGYIFLIIYYYW